MTSKTTMATVISMALLAAGFGCSSDEEGDAGNGGSGASPAGSTGGAGASGGAGGAQAASGGSQAGGEGGTSAATGGSGGTGAEGGSGTFGETACVECIVGECSDELAGCNGNADCKAYFDCIFACPAKNSHEIDEDCADTCVEPATPEAEAAAGAFFDCWDAVDGQDGDPPGVACEVPCD